MFPPFRTRDFDQSVTLTPGLSLSEWSCKEAGTDQPDLQSSLCTPKGNIFLNIFHHSDRSRHQKYVIVSNIIEEKDKNQHKSFM